MTPKRKRHPDTSKDRSRPKRARLVDEPNINEKEIRPSQRAEGCDLRSTKRRKEAENVERSFSGLDAGSESEDEGHRLASEKRSRKDEQKIKRKRTPTPPPDLPSHEQYFFDNRPGASTRTSTNTLSTLSLLTHEDYYDVMRRHIDPHRDEMDYLHHLHSRSFNQWIFELEEGFSLCLFGWGSKRMLLSAFAEYLASRPDADSPKIVMINGFIPSLTIRDILVSLASQLQSLKTAKLGSQTSDALLSVLSALSEQQHVFYLLLHSVDGMSLRRRGVQALLGELASHSRVHLIATADTPNFTLLWDAATRTRFNYIFHDATTFQSLEAEVGAAASGGGVVDEVNALLGRSGRRVHGREGVVFVLRSLTENARRLYGLLLSEMLSMRTDGNVVEYSGAEPDGTEFENALVGSLPNGDVSGVEYRSLYRKAVQALITGSEMTFRQLLKEFFDHQMVTSRRDGMGMEILNVPFRREECEAILEDLVVEE